MSEIVLDEALALRILNVVDQGLTNGLGVPEPGKLCVEAAVCYALGMPHGDNPVCVGSAVRKFKIGLNDARWSDSTARAKGMRRVAVAQLGSDKIDQVAFAKEVTLQVTRQLLPIALRAAASLNPDHAPALESAAVMCEALTEFAAVHACALLVKKTADAAYAAAADAADAADAAAAYAADAAAYAAYAAAADAVYARNSLLGKAAEIGVQALIKLGAEGCKFLALTEI